MKAYLDLLQKVVDEGVERTDRTGTGTLSLFGAQMRYALSDGFPAVTTKKLQFKSMAYELLWFLRGETNVAWLQAQNVRIWDAWAHASQIRTFCACNQATFVSPRKNHNNSYAMLLNWSFFVVTAGKPSLSA